MKNDFSPVFRFVICSDSHIEGIGSPGYNRLKEVIDYSLDFAVKDEHYNKIDTFFIAGDITNKGSKEEFDAFGKIYDYGKKKGLNFLCTVAKGHDSITMSKKSLDYYKSLTNQETDFHRVIGGFHFIGVSRSDTLSHYTDEQVEWLDKNIAEAVKADPEKPVFVFQHEHVRDTVYGSSKTDGWGLETFTQVLSKYPQVVHISGHSHFPANDPRAVWQGSFTAINDGGLAYYELAVDGKNGQFPENKDRMSQALIIEVDADNRVLVKVLDVDDGKIMREFLIDNITEPNKEKYSFETRKEAAQAPVFAQDADLRYEKNGLMHYITVPQAKVSEDNEVFLYRIFVLNEKGRTVYKDWAFSQYFFSDKPETITFDGFMMLRKNFTVKVCAEDVWGNRSEALEIKI